MEISCTSISAHAWRSVIFQPGYKHFLTSNLADGKNVQFTICILLRPTLWITVTETVVKAQRRLRWEIETIEVESGSHCGQTILLSARTSTKPPTIATQLSLALQQILCFHLRLGLSLLFSNNFWNNRQYWE